MGLKITFGALASITNHCFYLAYYIGLVVLEVHVVVHACNIRTWEAEDHKFEAILDGFHSKFQANLSYIVNP
jgi:hypothetical protein